MNPQNKDFLDKLSLKIQLFVFDESNRNKHLNNVKEMCRSDDRLNGLFEFLKEKNNDKNVS